MWLKANRLKYPCAILVTVFSASITARNTLSVVANQTAHGMTTKPVQTVTATQFPHWPVRNSFSREMVPPPPSGPYMSSALSDGQIKGPTIGGMTSNPVSATESPAVTFSPDIPWPEDKMNTRRWHPDNGYHFVVPNPAPDPAMPEPVQGLNYRQPFALHARPMMPALKSANHLQHIQQLPGHTNTMNIYGENHPQQRTIPAGNITGYSNEHIFRSARPPVFEPGYRAYHPPTWESSAEYGRYAQPAAGSRR